MGQGGTASSKWDTKLPCSGWSRETRAGLCLAGGSFGSDYACHAPGRVTVAPQGAGCQPFRWHLGAFAAESVAPTSSGSWLCWVWKHRIENALGWKGPLEVT